MRHLRLVQNMWKVRLEISCHEHVGCINPLQPSGHYMYHQFNITKFYVLPTQCICVFCVALRTNSDYFPIQHQLTGLYNRDGVCLLRGTDWVFKHTFVSCGI